MTRGKRPEIQKCLEGGVDPYFMLTRQLTRLLDSIRQATACGDFTSARSLCVEAQRLHRQLKTLASGQLPAEPLPQETAALRLLH